jgi:hypothetical protein
MAPSSPAWDELIASYEEALVEQIRRCDLPLVGLADPAPSPAMIVETSGTGAALDSLSLTYGEVNPAQAQGPLVLVHMSRPDESTVPLTLRYLLEVELDRADDGAVVAETTEPGELVVDGERRAATVQRAGARFWAARCAHADCLLTVVARDWDIASTRLASVTDLEPLILARRTELAALRARTPGPVDEPAADVENPHRALVEAVLHDSRYIEKRARQGLPPRHRELRMTAGLWRAATEAQMRMADQAHQEANAAVTAMVNQLSQLQEESDWFATDERLRRDAVAETLMYWTGLREAVPSRRAQESWKRMWDHRQRLATGEDLADPAWITEVRAHHDQVVNDRGEWLDIWNAWARGHGLNAAHDTEGA